MADGYKSGETAYGAATIRSDWMIADTNNVDFQPDCKTYNVNGRGGKLYNTDVLSGGTINNIIVAAHTSGNYGYLENIRIGNGGTVIIRSAGNSGADITVSNGGILHVQTLATATNVEVLDGGTLACTNNAQAGCYVSAVTVRAGGTAQFTTTAQSCNITDITVEAGASWTITTSFILSGDINFAVGTLTNDGDAYAESGTIYDLSLGITGTFGSGVTVSRFSKTAGTTVIGAGATVDTAALKGGTLYLSAGATGRNITQSAGTLTIEAGADVDGVTYNGGTFSIASGVTISNFNKNGTGSISMYGNAVIDGGVMTGGTLQAINTGATTVRNYTMRAPGANYLILRGAGLLAENVAVSGGSLCIQANATARNIDVYEGGDISTPGHQPGATYTNLTLHSSATGLLTTVNVGGLTMEQGAKLSINATKISGATISGGQLTNAGNCYISGGVSINELTVSGTGQLFFNDPYTAAGGAAYAPISADNLTVGAGLYVFMHGTNVTASNATVQGSMYVQNGAVATGGEIQEGGFVNMWARANYNDSGVRAKTVGMTVRSGGTAAATGADFVNMTTEAGAILALNNNAAIGGTANDIAAGTIVMNDVIDADACTDENHVLCNLDVSASILNVNSGIALADLNIQDTGRVYANDATISGGRVAGIAGSNALTMNGGAKFNEAQVSGGSVFLSANAEITNVEQTGGAVILRGSQTYVSKATVLGGGLYVQNGASGDDITVAGGRLVVHDTALTNPAGKVEVVNGVTMTTGQVEVSSGGTINGLTATGGVVYAFSSATINVQSGGALNDLQAYTGAKINFVENKNIATFTGSRTNIAEGTLYFNDTAVAGHAANGVLEGFNADNSTLGYKLSIGSGLVLKDAVGNNAAVRVSAFDGAVISGMTLRGGAIICVNGANVRVLDTTLTGEAGADQTCNLNLSAGAYASNVVVSANAKIQFQHADAKADNTTIMAGGSMVMTAAGDTGDRVTLDFTGATVSRVYITDLGKVSEDTSIVLKGGVAGTTYTIANTGATNRYVSCGEWGLYDDAVKGGEKFENAFTGMSYDFNTTGTAITVGTFTAAAQATAGSIENGTTINTNGKAAKWTANTGVEAGATYKAATSAIAGDAWLELDGANLAGTTLFGAATGFAGGVNLYATGDAVINNLAAGAEAGGTVESVKLTVDDATVGLAYAGGFGTVANAAETLIEGGTFQKDFYAGALANYAKTGHATQVGSVSLTIEGGEFNGNVYGAASVKAGAAASVVHSVGNVSITLAGGNTTKEDFCCFAGGYATGSTANKVYTVGTVEATITDGYWGEAHGGRGFFGGAFASGVEAEAQNVIITIDGGSFGNVYGGGWAQKYGTSTVDDVNITITGGTVANVFGGGSHSTSGGSTAAGDVTITVSGGNITGAIYARGQLEGDAVTGTASVIFTGAANFSCGVFGYSYVEGPDSDATLSYTDYTGEFSGKLGGFNSGVTFDGATAMTLTTAADDVSNTKWEFDLTDRADTLAETSLLTWDGADFENDTIRVNFTDATQAASEWSIANAVFDESTTFTLAINGVDVTTVAYDTMIDEGDWTGWMFTTDENGTLKFKQLA